MWKKRRRPEKRINIPQKMLKTQAHCYSNRLLMFRVMSLMISPISESLLITF